MAPQVAVEVASSDCVRPWVLIMLIPSSENGSCRLGAVGQE